ncbi:hypothetical protein NECAME_17186 [Necator americanus]|uniref:Uncharacterized protein n=1 Tax=Necator americanus TaxID=51031 RepID=W2TT42_NECAM|nr:hypothetical protein NECAME_17186 [Necator americanus]ETN84256.1 hypothetical protein NECAME_17186 [Necator americanus]
MLLDFLRAAHLKNDCDGVIRRQSTTCSRTMLILWVLSLFHSSATYTIPLNPCHANSTFNLTIREPLLCELFPKITWYWFQFWKEDPLYSCILEDDALLKIENPERLKQLLPNREMLEKSFSEKSSKFDAKDFAKKAVKSWSPNYKKMRSHRRFGCNHKEENGNHTVVCLFVKM